MFVLNSEHRHLKYVAPIGDVRCIQQSFNLKRTYMRKFYQRAHSTKLMVLSVLCLKIDGKVFFFFLLRNVSSRPLYLFIFTFEKCRTFHGNVSVNRMPNECALQKSRYAVYLMFGMKRK